MKTTMRTIRWSLAFGAVVLLSCTNLLVAASPPERINFQGVLRDNAGAPVDGSQAMTFRLYDTDGGCPGLGILLLTNDHASVSVSGGLFNVALGDGTVTAGTASSLAEAFRDNAAVFVEVQVTGETLCPRVRVHSAGYSLNADHLDGVDSSGFIDTSATTQRKSGILEAYGGVDFGAGIDDDLTAADVITLTDGASSADALHGHASAGNADTLDGNDSSFFIDT